VERLSYSQDRIRRRVEMEELQRSLERIREIVRQDKIASHNNTLFGNLVADTILDGMLQDASALNAKIKTKIKVKKCAA
jgi:hypothetical protein